MKKILLSLLLIFVLVVGVFAIRSCVVSNKIQSNQLNRLQQKAIEAKAFCKSKKMNTNFCILIDMNVHSGKNRFYIYDFKKDTVLDQGLVSHGCCDNQWGAFETVNSPTFSNVPESHCSSIGKFKVGKRGYSSWGIHVNYKMHGLENTNSNAYKRFIVLHSWDAVMDKEIYPLGTPEGWGCPAVSKNFMKRIDKKLKAASNKGVLMWIFQ